MNQPSATPRTDAAVAKIADMNTGYQCGYLEEHARQLERELAAMTGLNREHVRQLNERASQSAGAKPKDGHCLLDVPQDTPAKPSPCAMAGYCLKAEESSPSTGGNTSALLEGVTDLPGLVAALGFQKQCDEDGTNCEVSRQAVDEARMILARLIEGRSTPSAITAITPSPDTLWMVYYEDAAVKPELFFGPGAEAGARARYEQALYNWSCHLLVRVPTVASPDRRGDVG